MSVELSTLTAATTPGGTELIPVLQGGNARKLTVQQILDKITSGSGTTLPGVKVLSPLANSADNRAQIQAALDDATVNEVLLGPGTFWISAAVLIPSGKTLRGHGMFVSIIKAMTGFTPFILVYSATNSNNVSVYDLQIDANRQGSQVPANNNRINGLQFSNGKNFIAKRVYVRNTTGYGIYCAGGANNYAAYCEDVIIQDCITENCQVHQEQQYARNVRILNCMFSPVGDGGSVLDNLSWAHPWLGAENITYIGCKGKGAVGAAIDVTAHDKSVKDIRFIGCDFEVTSANIGISIPIGNLVNSVRQTAKSVALIGTRVWCESGPGAVVFEAEVILTAGSKVRGAGEGFQLNSNSTVYLNGAEVIGYSNPAGTGVAYGINIADGTSRGFTSGGRVQAIGPAGLMEAIRNPQLAVIGNSTELIPAQAVSSAPVSETSYANGTFSALSVDGTGKVMATSAGGLSLYGKGSTYDINFGNGAGATVMAVDTGTANLELFGRIRFSVNGTYAGIPHYASDAAADSDNGLAFGSLYRTGRDVRVKI